MSTTPKKKLNVASIEKNLESAGLNGSDLASKLKVSRQIVSDWLNNKKFPRPSKLLELARLLGLSFDELVIKEAEKFQPVIAFRKKGNHKIKSDYIEEARGKGRLLRNLVDFLPFDNMVHPPSLLKPSDNYVYVQKVADGIRKKVIKKDEEEISFESLIDFFSDYHAVIIPVFWGSKQHHENALHIHLPETVTTWIYLNLDSQIHDFKFWMAHELGHMQAINLRDEEGEDFADAFAGALLFSGSMAESEYAHLRRLTTNSQRIARLKRRANELTVSPLTIYYEVNKYANHSNKTLFDLESDKAIYKANFAFNKRYKSVAGHLFDNPDEVATEDYISCSEEIFNSCFFKVLGKYLKKSKKPSSFVQSLLNVSLLDAKNIYDEIC